jgi:hypothetical protein
VITLNRFGGFPIVWTALRNNPNLLGRWAAELAIGVALLAAGVWLLRQARPKPPIASQF